MCGRYSHKLSWREIPRLAGLTSQREVQLTIRYNVAPSQKASVIRELRGERRLDELQWGLVPSWSKEANGGQTIARAETVATKPSFRAAFKQRRCLIPASGFYEWKKFDGKERKQPYHIQFASEEPMFLAGVWETWMPPTAANQSKPTR
jgi:putative SOS response-associated peptidase YedK